MSRGEPAKAEGLMYGELPKRGLVGPRGRICQQLCPLFLRKSMKSMAGWPMSPMPWGPGREKIGSKIPLDL